MHVHELNPKRTVITMILFVIVIVVGLVTLTNPRLKYEISPGDAILLASSDNQGVDASKIENLLSGSNNPAIIIDIRNNYDYARGHIASAYNVSAVELLTNDNIDWLDDLKKNDTKVIIYGGTPTQANGPWMVLQQLGYSNITFLKGGYDYYLKYVAANNSNTTLEPYVAGKANYNYAEVAKNSTSAKPGSNTSEKKHVVVKRRKKTAAAAGGC